MASGGKNETHSLGEHRKGPTLTNPGSEKVQRHKSVCETNWGQREHAPQASKKSAQLENHRVKTQVVVKEETLFKKEIIKWKILVER